MTAETIAKALGGRKVGQGWTARCPAHDDREPSLSIRDADGKVLVRCHAGCDQRDVIAALKERGLWDARSARSLRDIASAQGVAAATRSAPGGAERCRACHLAIHAPGRMARWSRLISPRAA